MAKGLKFDEAREQFIDAWGSLGSNWGINRTMAQIHAYLLSSHELQSTEDIMEGLKVSRGNANMNLRALLDWGLIKKSFRSGERRDFFEAHKDVWYMARQIIKERKRREIEPAAALFKELETVEGKKEDVVEFRKLMQELSSYSQKVDQGLDKLISADQNWFLNTLFKLLRP